MSQFSAGLEPTDEPNVTIIVYNFPVPDVPEYGVLMMVNARSMVHIPWVMVSTRNRLFS